MGFWNTYGVGKFYFRQCQAHQYVFAVQDTDRWRHELALLASASGLGLEKDEQKYNNKPPTATIDQQHASRSGAHYSVRTGRFNEGTAKSRGRTGSKHATPYSDTLFNVPEHERELWVRSRFYGVSVFPSVNTNIDFRRRRANILDETVSFSD